MLRIIYLLLIFTAGYFSILNSKDVSLQLHATESGQQSDHEFRPVIYSALLPGSGEFVINKKRNTYIHTLVEITAWLGFFVYNLQGNWLRDDYLNLAVQKAHIDVNKVKDDEEFLNALENGSSMDSFNVIQRFLGEDEYQPERGYFWRWDSRDDQIKFEKLRNKSTIALRKVKLAAGLVVFNHILSALNTFRLTKSSESVSVRAEADLYGYKISLIKPVF